MKVSEIRNMTVEDIEKKLKEEYKNLQDLYFSLAFRQLVNTAAIKNTKKTIARLQTVLTEKKGNN
ncbi:MAG TPA: 50S ribosomal protein L29 [Ignavibacteriales bacterium]|nr:50S ribosomal protein L29 [Ignavibacteriales bacterium]